MRHGAWASRMLPQSSHFPLPSLVPPHFFSPSLLPIPLLRSILRSARGTIFFRTLGGNAPTQLRKQQTDFQNRRSHQ